MRLFQVCGGTLILLAAVLLGCQGSLKRGVAFPGEATRIGADVSPAQLSGLNIPLIGQAPLDTQVLWANDFSQADWFAHWDPEARGTWGSENFEVVDAPEPFQQVLRVHYPARSASPAVANEHGVPLGGGEFRGSLNIPPQEALRLSYYIRFSDDFEFVRGGKLPGLYGGTANSGGDIPDGTDGFSARMMWRRDGHGEVYAYLPTSEGYGTSLSQGNWQFEPGRWHHLIQEVALNRPGHEDGRVRVWLDGELVLDQKDLVFRKVDDLKINGIFFLTFFGGGDPSWATPKAVYADFANFSVWTAPAD